MKFLAVCLLIIHTSSGILNETVDIGYGFDENMIYFGMPFNPSEAAQPEGLYMMAKQLESGEHGGTHLDAPFHYNPDGWTVADIPLDRLIVPGVVIDKRDAASEDVDAEVTVRDLVEWEQAHGQLPNPVVVIFDFGWANKYPNKTEYFGIVNGNKSNIHFPGVSEGAADWLVRSGKVVGVGVDTPSVDRGVNTEFIAHRLLSAANIYLIEKLALEGTELPARGFQLIVMPMKIINGTGAPLRIVARPTKSSAGFFSNIWSYFYLRHE